MIGCAEWLVDGSLAQADTSTTNVAAHLTPSNIRPGSGVSKIVRERIVHESPWRERWRRVRRAQLAAERLAAWLIDPDFARPQIAATRPAHLIGEVRVPIGRAGAHATLEAGKRHNVALAATALDGVIATPFRAFSFWRAVGPATAARGYVAGMELRAGCAVPAIGGGICVVTNALFQLACELGWTIVERHAHTQAVGDVLALDATVAYPHVDLRFRPPGEVALSVQLRGDVLVVAAHAHAPARHAPHPIARMSRPLGDGRYHVVIGRGGETLVDEIRTALAHDAPTCLDCAESCHAKTPLLRAAKL